MSLIPVAKVTSLEQTGSETLELHLANMLNQPTVPNQVFTVSIKTEAITYRIQFSSLTLLHMYFYLQTRQNSHYQILIILMEHDLRRAVAKNKHSLLLASKMNLLFCLFVTNAYCSSSYGLKGDHGDE